MTSVEQRQDIFLYLASKGYKVEDKDVMGWDWFSVGITPFEYCYRIFHWLIPFSVLQLIEVSVAGDSAIHLDMIKYTGWSSNCDSYRNCLYRFNLYQITTAVSSQGGQEYALSKAKECLTDVDTQEWIRIVEENWTTEKWAIQDQSTTTTILTTSKLKKETSPYSFL